MTRFQLKLLGRAVIEGPEGPLSGPITQRSRLAFLTRLALSPDAVSSREKLMACLWPERDSEHARHALSNSLYVIRDALGADAVLTRGNDLQLNLERVHVDAVELEDTIEAGDYEAATGLYMGPLLDGFHLDGAPEFERWLDGRRDRLARAHGETLERLAREDLAEGRPKEAVRRLRQLVAYDPFNTRVALLLMEALAAAGDPANAIECAEEHIALLRSEMGMAPPAEVRELMARLRVSADAKTEVRSATRDRPSSVAPSSRTPSAAVPVAALPPFVAREKELARLHCHLGRVRAGNGQPVFITGEAGTGKTVLAREFCRQALDRHPEVVVAVGRGNAQTGVGDPYLPFRDILALLTGDVEAGGVAGSLTRAQATRMLRVLPETGRLLTRHGPDLVGTFLRAEPLLDRVRTQARGEAWVDDLARLAEREPSAPVPGVRQTDLFRQYARLLHEVARKHPVVLVLDDLQWADTGSVDLLFQLGRGLRRSPILVLGLYRASEVALGRAGERHPLEPMIHELVRRFGDVEIPLLQTGDRAFVDALLDLECNRLDATFRKTLFDQTRGHALFTVELLREMRENAMLVRDDSGCWVTAPSLSWEDLPPRVEAVIGERIDRLPGSLRAALLAASVEGEEFTAEAIAPLCSLECDQLIVALSQDLDKRHHLVKGRGSRRIDGQRLSRYRFRHALFQKYLFDRLSPAERASLHGQMGRALEGLYGDRAEDEAVVLARHFRAAEVFDRAAHYLQKAGEQAAWVGAIRESVAFLHSAVECLLELPPTPERDRRELGLQIALGNSLYVAGAPDQDEAFARAAELASEVGDPRGLFWALAGLYLVRGHGGGDNRLGRELAERCLAIARDEGDTSLLVYAHEFVGRNAMNRGRFRSMLQNYEQLLSLHDPDRHDYEVLIGGMELESLGLGMSALGYWLVGRPDRAVQLSREALDIALGSDMPAGLPILLYYEVLIHMFVRDVSSARRQCEELRRVAEEQGQAMWEPCILISLGWCDAHEGSIEPGIDLIRAGLARFEAMGYRVWSAYYTSLLAQALGRCGSAEEGLAILDEAHASAQVLEELVHDAEVRRIRGELLLATAQPDPEEAELAFRDAITVARKQEARSYELRATTSLARLLQSQDRREDARSTLSEIYGWFTEGFDTLDLQEARALLAELA